MIASTTSTIVQVKTAPDAASRTSSARAARPTQAATRSWRTVVRPVTPPAYAQVFELGRIVLGHLDVNGRAVRIDSFDVSKA
jgi:hypothetical protein